MNAKHTFTRPATSFALCAGLCFAGSAVDNQAQLTPGQRKQLGEFFGNRGEVSIILGASDAASRGRYTVDGRRGTDDFDFSLVKFDGGGEIGPVRQFGDDGMMWRPVIMGSAGYISGDNHIAVGPFRGNKLEESGLGFQVGGGMALHFSEQFTVTPTIGMLYGSYDPGFKGRTPNGNIAEAVVDDDTASTLGITPSIGMTYKVPMGRNMWKLTARYTYYGTTEISGTDIDAAGDSHIFEQRADLDIPLPVQLWNCPLHTGGYFSLTESAGHISDALNSDLWATIHGRLLLDIEGESWSWKMSRVGLGLSGIFAQNFSGWDAGLEIQFKF